MSNLRNLRARIFLYWDSTGNVHASSEPESLASDDEAMMLSWCSLALINHLFTTLSCKNVSLMTIKVVTGIVDNTFTTSPISSVIRRLTLKVYAQNDYIYTILEPHTKLFVNNHEVEQAMIQIAINTITSSLLKDNGKYSQELRTSLYGQIVWLEAMVKDALNNNERGLQAKERFVKTGIIFLNKFPQNFKEAGLLEKYMAETLPKALINDLTQLPGDPDKPLFT